jgi:hypothetical protein
MRIDFSLSIGYVRHRPGAGVEDRWEAHVGTVGLLVTGAIATAIILLILVPRIFEALSR